jgi:hypothetical protein
MLCVPTLSALFGLQIFTLTFKQPQHLAWLNPKCCKVTQPEVSLITYYGSNMTLWNVCHTDSISTVETAIPLLKHKIYSMMVVMMMMMITIIMTQL